MTLGDWIAVGYVVFVLSLGGVGAWAIRRYFKGLSNGR
jgi:hypothetical protein